MKNLSEAEIQLITSLTWFRSRYALYLNKELDRQANRESIEEFGTIWMGKFKVDWEGSFDALVAKEILVCTDGEYAFTPLGNKVKTVIESVTPFYKYEYDLFFNSEQTSAAHSRFCEKVYGIDLAQHGMIDAFELNFLIEKLRIQQPASVADIGCGNGKITEYLASQVPACFIGIDISSEGIAQAKERTRENPQLTFEEGNLNSLKWKSTYDAILFLDTLYYADDMKTTLVDSAKGLSENGRMYAYFSQWIMDETYAENLAPENTHLAKVLKELGWEFSTTNLTETGIRHWKKKLEVLEEMTEEFIEEGNKELWEYRYREALRYAHWGETKYSRYLYEFRKQ